MPEETEGGKGGESAWEVADGDEGSGRGRKARH